MADLFDSPLTVAVPDESERACLVAALSRRQVPFMVLAAPQPAVLVLQQHAAVLKEAQRACGEAELQTCQTCKHWRGMGETRDVAVRGICGLAGSTPDAQVQVAMHINADLGDEDAVHAAAMAIGQHVAGPPRVITVFDWRCKGWERLDSQESTGHSSAEG